MTSTELPATPTVRFTATLRTHGKTATGIVVPAGLIARLGKGKRPDLLLLRAAGRRRRVRQVVVAFGSWGSVPGCGSWWARGDSRTARWSGDQPLMTAWSTS